MRFFPSLLVAGLAVASPVTLEQPVSRAGIGNVKIIGVSAIGSGCPAGHAYVNVDATGSIFDVAFDEFTAEVGPGMDRSENRKNCRVSINLQFDAGTQFAVMDTRFNGYASLPSGITGTLRAAYTFSGFGGSQPTVSSTIRGPYENNYVLESQAGIVAWSPCGGSTAILNVNSEVRLTPASTDKEAYMTVDSFDGRLHVIFAINWQRC